MTREELLRLYEKANGWSPAGWEQTELELTRFAALVAEAEREVCAQLCDTKDKLWPDEGGTPRECAAAIRARGEK